MGLGAPVGVGLAKELTERSQFGVKWFGVRGLGMGERRVRRPPVGLGRGMGRRFQRRLRLRVV
jgi:hypothetical protein